MSEFADSGDLFTIRTQFYTGQHSKVAAHDLGQFSPESQLKAFEFQVRATVALGDDASSLIENGRTLFPDLPEVLDVLQAWNDLNTFGTDESTYFDDVVEAEFEAQAVLTAIYLVKFHKDVDLAVAVLTAFTARASENVLELEPYLLLVQLHLFKENFGDALKVYQKFQTLPFGARDDIVFQVLESWINSVKGESDNISNAYYFYDELLSSGFDDAADAKGRLHVLSVLFAMTLQLKHYPEAQELLDQVAALDYTGPGTADLLANRVTYEYLTRDGADVVALLRELAAADPDHQLLADFKEKNERFDAIVEKYQVA